ncbi:MAG: hypothetical protein JNL41_08865 [Phenylobacterium sp.]|uniref:hypothetical protein n=1 Tax=Phenylobacterium sp. TaxID=1871053 RepID=UPI001A641A87|nr:hypothetical protein [Phenylobacterium sp.]MBL8554376.1 hypothetical protein [Phenylobacterium sp.]
MPLDMGAYSTTVFDRRTVPFPDWVCRAPDGGIHIDAGRLEIDLDIVGAPNRRDEISWACDYGVHLVAHSWLEEIRDLIDAARVGIGVLRRNGVVVDGWSTVHERQPPPLLATEGHGKVCPHCGHSYTVLHGREYFSDPNVIGRSFVENSNGLFIRADIALSRGLRTPRGAFEPGVVEFEPDTDKAA